MHWQTRRYSTMTLNKVIQHRYSIKVLNHQTWAICLLAARLVDNWQLAALIINICGNQQVIGILRGNDNQLDTQRKKL